MEGVVERVLNECLPRLIQIAPWCRQRCGTREGHKPEQCPGGAGRTQHDQIEGNVKI